MLKKQLSLLLLIVVLGVPAFHKFSNEIPPDWFVTKFEDSFIGKLPMGFILSYGVIMLLETIGPLFFIVGSFQLWKGKNGGIWISRGFAVYYILFLILTLGSFLVEDYDNGFKDFLYFIGVLVIDQIYFSSKPTEKEKY